MTSDSSRAVALLRGINVGKGNRIAMADLRECTESVGCRDVATVLASGNVVLTHDRPIPELRQALEAAFAERFSYDAVVQVFPRAAVADAVEGYPFESLPEHHDYVVFSDSRQVAGRVAELMNDAVRPDSTESVAAGPDWVYWRVSRGDTLKSAAAKVLDSRENKVHLTTRNLKTLLKILAVG